MKKVVLLLIVLFFFLLFYFSVEYNFSFIFCPIYKFLNIYCPGCGVTRMIVSILKLDFYQAFRYNAFLFIFSPFFFVCGIDEFCINFLNKKSFFVNRINNKVWFLILIFAILFGVVRNFSMFDYFIPTDL